MTELSTPKFSESLPVVKRAEPEQSNRPSAADAEPPTCFVDARRPLTVIIRYHAFRVGDKTKVTVCPRQQG